MCQMWCCSLGELEMSKQDKTKRTKGRTKEKEGGPIYDGKAIYNYGFRKGRESLQRELKALLDVGPEDY